MGLLQTVQFLVLPPLDDCAVAAAASWARTTDTASKIGKIYLVHLHYAKRALDRAPYSWNMVNLFSLGCHVTDRAYVRTRLQIVRVG